jgi:hypothetical protein
LRIVERIAPHYFILHAIRRIDLVAVIGPFRAEQLASKA